MPNFVDIHSHILPGFDDGVANFEQALEILKMSSDDGITHIVATPHHVAGVINQSPEEIKKAIEKLQIKTNQLKIPIIILPGMEVRLSSNLVEWIRNKEILTLNGSGKYILVEFPFNEVPNYAPQICFELRLTGLIPVIAHPERNADIIRKPSLVKEYTKMDCLIQLTSSSVIGLEGRSAKRTSFELINLGLAHIIASDSHSPRHRTPCFREAFSVVKKHFSEEIALNMVSNIPKRILNLV